ncbi:MAG: AAA family ATPase, partial [Candidatus Melainabacteria bacterium]|nr:AAA family ATPase [Candidatus Melainabacteria bacterium]
MAYIKREIEALVKKAAKQFAAVVITGARQTGKSTMVKQLFPKAEFISFDVLPLRAYAKSDPVAFLNDYKSKQIILDEIQEVPELLSYIKLAIDQDRKPGQFIITGSQQFSLMEGVQESLAGRAAVLELLTFSFGELKGKVEKKKWYELAYQGFYPEIWAKRNLDLELWYSSYIKTFVDRDISVHLREKNIFNYVRLIELLA